MAIYEIALGVAKDGDVLALREAQRRNAPTNFDLLDALELAIDGVAEVLPDCSELRTWNPDKLRGEELQTRVVDLLTRKGHDVRIMDPVVELQGSGTSVFMQQEAANEQAA